MTIFPRGSNRKERTKMEEKHIESSKTEEKRTESKTVRTKFYLADIIVENAWGYHYEALWYGSEPAHLASMVMDVMNSWYKPNREKLDPSIRAFHERMEKMASPAEGEAPAAASAFLKMKGEMFHASGLRLEIQLTNDLMEIFDFVSTQIYEIFMAKDKAAEDFENLPALFAYMEENYPLDEVFVNALHQPSEGSLSAALYLIDLKYHYTKRTFRQQSLEQQS